ncbi:adenylate/guanylate cyclase domain-containing protein [Nocardioides sp. zg-DK7169]|nr:adenylate/guanylate cyclase domain-containing protein [Nocardioides sp. zg-DK7169]
MEGMLLGAPATLTRAQVADRAGVDLAVAQELWRLMGFADVDDADVAFTEADVQALRDTERLVALGVLGPERRAALVRTWGRSYARLAEWQTRLLTEVAADGADPAVPDRAGRSGRTDAGLGALAGLAEEVVPLVESLQGYVWRRHLASATARTLAAEPAASPVSDQTVCFVDIVGYTHRSRALSERGLAAWLERFEETCADTALDHGARVIKNIGDEVLLVADTAACAAEVALTLTARGADPDDDFPEVRAGLAHGPVLSRLGDVFGEAVNVAARLTALARPGTVLVDSGARAALDGSPDEAAAPDGAGGEALDEAGAEPAAYSLRRLRRASVKDYPRVGAWVLRRA